jgi:hypothetical protein
VSDLNVILISAKFNIFRICWWQNGSRNNNYDILDRISYRLKMLSRCVVRSIEKFLFLITTSVSKQSGIKLVLSNGLNFWPKAVSDLDPSLLMSDFAMSHIVWDVTSGLARRVSHHSSAFSRLSRLIDFETQFPALLHSGSMVSCHRVLSLIL